MATIGSWRRAPLLNSAIATIRPNTMWAASSNGSLASSKVSKAIGENTSKLTRYSADPKMALTTLDAAVAAAGAVGTRIAGGRLDLDHVDGEGCRSC